MPAAIHALVIFRPLAIYLSKRLTVTALYLGLCTRGCVTRSGGCVLIVSAETINTQPPERVTQPRVHRPKYKAVTVKRLLKYIASGLNITKACIAAGIDRRTYYVWRVSHPELDSLLEKAREECRLRALAAIKVAAKDDWRAMVEFLKLSYHNDYQRNGNTVNVGVQGNASIEVTDV